MAASQARVNERERDAEITAPQVAAVLLVAVIMIMVVIVAADRAKTSEIRDLQRRVGQLESTGR